MQIYINVLYYIIVLIAIVDFGAIELEIDDDVLEINMYSPWINFSPSIQ